MATSTLAPCPSYPGYSLSPSGDIIGPMGRPLKEIFKRYGNKVSGPYASISGRWVSMEKLSLDAAQEAG